jgi:putative ABC transport system permease protein
MGTLVRLAARNLWRNSRRTLITLSAVVIGVGVVVFLTGFKNGFNQMMLLNTVEVRTGALQVHVRGYVGSNESLPVKLNFKDDEGLAKKILSVGGVTHVAPRINFGGMVSNGLASGMFIGTAVDPAREYAVAPRAREQLLSGRPLEVSDKNGMLIGQELSKSFKADPGTSLTLLAQGPEGAQNVLEAVVQGFPNLSNPFEGKRVVSVPLAFAQELLGMPGRVTEFAVSVSDIGRVDEIAALVQAAIGDAYEVHTWRQLAPFILDIIRRQDFVLSLVSTVLFIIVVTGIINTMIMSTFERVREIGTMMALGVRRQSILALFLAESIILGLTGGAVGALAGLSAVLTLGARGLTIDSPGGGRTVLYPFVGAGFIGLTVFVAFLGAVISALWPAWTASRPRPVEALRAT